MYHGKFIQRPMGCKISYQKNHVQSIGFQVIDQKYHYNTNLHTLQNSNTLLNLNTLKLKYKPKIPALPSSKSQTTQGFRIVCFLIFYKGIIYSDFMFFHSAFFKKDHAKKNFKDLFKRYENC